MIDLISLINAVAAETWTQILNMSKGAIAFILIAAFALGALLIVELKKSADDAHKRSDEILNDFNTVDKSLQESNARLDSLNTMLPDSILVKYK